jgi:hypothetical protein
MAKKVSESYTNIADRVEAAENVQSNIRRYAHGKVVDTRAPEGVTLPKKGSANEIVHADAADDASRVMGVDGLAGLMSMKNAGVNTADPESMVRNAWAVPDVTPPSAVPGFLTHAAADRKTAATEEGLSTLANSRLEELRVGSDFAPFRKKGNLRTNSRNDKVFESMVSERTSKFSPQLAPWYEGRMTGQTTPEGAPIYEEGNSRMIINQVAAEKGLDPDVVRRGTAMGSPKSVWSTKDGRYPNVTGAATVIERSLANPAKSHAQVSKSTGEGDPISGVFLGDRREAVSEMARGEHSDPRRQINPGSGRQVPTAKQSNFDFGLVSPHSERYGYSAWVASEKSKAYTSDTHDLGVAGVKTPSKVLTDEEGNIRYKVDKSGNKKLDSDGKPIAMRENAGEKWLAKPGSYDISRASALVSLADQFSDHFEVARSRGDDPEKWARENAHKYTLNNAQASWWGGERGME